MSDLVLSVLMLAGLALLAGAVLLWRKGDKQRALLMLAAGMVMLANVAIWLAPAPAGDAPPEQRAAGD